jgi:hypothetical protein
LYERRRRADQLLQRVVASDRRELRREVAARRLEPARGELEARGNIERRRRELGAIEVDGKRRRQLGRGAPQPERLARE